MLAIARQEAPRLASIEGRKLLRQQPSCLRLLIVRVGNEMDLDTLLVAAHWHTHEQRLRGAREPSVIARGRFKWSRRSLRANVKSSMTHHSLEQYVGPATTSSVWQPARKTGKQASDCWMLPWSMHALSCGDARGAPRVGGRHQPECRFLAGHLLAPPRPAQHDRVLGAGRLVLVSPRVAQKGGHFPHRRRHRLGRQFSGAAAHPKPRASQVCGLQPAGGQAAESFRGALERGVGIAAADERRDRRRLGTATPQVPQAAVDAATSAGSGEGGKQEDGDAHGHRICPVEEEMNSELVALDRGPCPNPGRRGGSRSTAAAGRGGGCMARSLRQRSVGASAQRVPKSSAASGKPKTGRQTPRSVAEMATAPNPVHTTTKVTHATRIARASVGKRARRMRQMPSGNGTSHQSSRPTAASIDRPAKYMTAGVAQITNSAHPACPMAKLTRSRRPTADARAAHNFSLTAAELAAAEGVL
eukprot:scaffold32480_cov68-Phaeocystis_antarctica.AAC.5